MCECKCGTNDYVTTAKELLSGKRSCGCIRKKKGFNDYRIDGDTTIIYFRDKMDEIIMEGYIDTDDLQMLIDLDYHWCLMWNVHSQNWYARTTEYYLDENGNRKTRLHSLHREIMQVFEKDLVVDHREHKNTGTLNNRKSNLRIATDGQNSGNRKSKNSNNKSGYRNVLLDKKSEKYIIMLCINYKRFRVGKYYDDVHEAGRDAEMYRKEYYKEFAGKS